MSADGDRLAAIFAAMADTPTRLAALERANEATRADLALIRAALPPVLLTLPEAADAFKVSVQTMRRWVRAGKVPTIKIGSTVRVDMSRLHGVDGQGVVEMARATVCGKLNPLAVISGRH